MAYLTQFLWKNFARNECGTSGRTSILFFLLAGFNTFFAFFTKEKGRIKHFAADFIFWVRVKNRVNCGSPLRQVKNQAQEHRYLSLILGIFVYLPAIVRLKGVAYLKTKHRKNESFFFLPEVIFFTAEHRQQSL